MGDKLTSNRNPHSGTTDERHGLAERIRSKMKVSHGIVVLKRHERRVTHLTASPLISSRTLSVHMSMSHGRPTGKLYIKVGDKKFIHHKDDPQFKQRLDIICDLFAEKCKEK